MVFESSPVSLFKVPLTLLIAWGFNKCTAPQYPPAPKDAKRTLTRGESEWFGQVFMPLASRAYYLASISEALVILACHFPSSHILQSLAGHLTANISTGICTKLALSRQQTLGAMLVLAGTFIRLYAFAHMGDLFAFTAAVRKDHRLITTGPYSIVRHPGYAGVLLSHPGFLLWTFASSSWLHASGAWDYSGTVRTLVVVYTFLMLAPWLMIVRRSRVEDEALRGHFGEEWNRWAEKVRYRVVPGVF